LRVNASPCINGLAQHGGKFVDAKPLKGFGGAGVLEAIEDWQGDTFRLCLHGPIRRGGLRAPRFPEDRDVETVIKPARKSRRHSPGIQVKSGRYKDFSAAVQDAL
jgi:hypothetical protein